jgi:monomeric sarcosine oxidase
MNEHYDCVVLGCGGVGSATLYQLADRGVRVLGLDRFAPPHEHGSSHGETRIFRRAYFEHPDYVPLLQRSYELWQQLQDDGAELFRQTGLLQVGPSDGQVLPAVLESASRHGLDVEEMSAGDIERRYRGFRVPRDSRGVYEPGAGVLAVEDCVRAFLEKAVGKGATLHAQEPVIGWSIEGEHVVVRTVARTYRAEKLVIAAGAWAAGLVEDLGTTLTVRRKALFWYGTRTPVYRADHGCPAFLFEEADGLFYGFPEFESGGLKVAEHSGGKTVTDPLRVNPELDLEDRRRVENFLDAHLPDVGRPYEKHRVCRSRSPPVCRATASSWCRRWAKRWRT